MAVFKNKVVLQKLPQFRDDVIAGSKVLAVGRVNIGVSLRTFQKIIEPGQGRFLVTDKKNLLAGFNFPYPGEPLLSFPLRVL